MVVVKVLEFIDADKEAFIKFEQDIKLKKYKVFSVGGLILLSFGEDNDSSDDFKELVEESAFDLGIDFAKAKLMYLDEAKGQVHNSVSVMNDFAKESGLDNISYGVPISLITELIDYIFKNEVKINTEISELILLEESESSSFVDDVTPKGSESSTFVDDVTLKGLESSSFVDDVLIREHYPVDKSNYLLEKSIALFDSHSHTRLPKFDDVTNKELQKEVVDAQFTVANARDRVIDEIYNRLKAETKDSKQRFEVQVLKNSRESHENTINTIERNLTNDINNLLASNDSEYEKAREDYVLAKIPSIRKKYDSEHYADYQSVLSKKIDEIRKESNKKIEEENQRFASYVEEVFKENNEKLIDKLVLDDIIDSYNKIATEQKELLMLHANGLKGKIGETMNEIINERNDLKSELELIASKEEEQKANEAGIINDKIEEGIRLTKEKLEKEAQKKLADALKKEQDLLSKLDLLDSTIESLKEENSSLKREYIVPIATEKKEDVKINEQIMPGTYPQQTRKLTVAKLVVGGLLGVSFLAVGLLGVSSLSGMHKDLTQQNQISKLNYLATLEANSRFKKVDEKMRDFGYKKNAISEMYLDNGLYISALRTDSGILNDFYDYLSKKDSEKQKEILGIVLKEKVLSASQEKGIRLRLAIVNKDTPTVVKLAKSIDKDSAKVAIAYLIDNKDLEDAQALLKTYPDAKLAEKFKLAKNK